MDVVGLGFTSLDYLGLVPHLPALDQGVNLLDFSRQGGGPVAQALVTLARLGASTGFVGRIGDDEAGRTMRCGLVAEGVDVSQLQIEAGAASGECIILVDSATGKRSICANRGSVHDVATNELDLDYLCSGRILHLDGHSPAAALLAAGAARAAGVTVCLDAGGPELDVGDLVKLTDVLIAGERFAAAVGDGDDRQGATRLLAMGPRIVVVTRGERGSFTKTADEEFQTPVFRVPVVDTTGAGDVFHGAYLFGLLRGWDLPSIAEFAGATAALKCLKLGGRAGIPTLDTVMTYLRQQGRPPPAMIGEDTEGQAVDVTAR
jgi:sulfofructose kinase